jgi:hypothetical protein
MQHPVQKFSLYLPRPPYAAAVKGFMIDTLSHDAGAGQGQGHVNITTAEAVARLRELADYIEQHTK